MPTWDTTLNVPLMNKYYYVADLVDSVNFFADANNRVIFQTTGEVKTLEVGSIGIETDVSTGVLPLPSNRLIQAAIPFSDVANGREVSYGVFGAGRLRYQFSNINPALTGVQITFAEIQNAANQPLVIPYNQDSSWQWTNLAGYHIGVPGSNVIVDTIHISLWAESPLPVGTVIGNINLLMNDPLSFSRFRGRLTDYPLDVEDNDTSVDIDYPWGAENAIELQGATIHIDMTNEMEFDAEMHGYFWAKNFTTGEEDSIAVLDANARPYVIAGANGGLPTTTEIVFSGDVGRLLRLLPERIELRSAYFLIVSTNNTIGELNYTDRIEGSYIADAPLTFTLHNSLVSPQDSVEIEITEDNRNKIRDNVLDSLYMNLFVTNRLPVGATANVYFGIDPNLDVNDNTTWKFTKTARIQSSQVDIGEQSIPLWISNEDIMLFTNPKVYMKMTFSFDETTTPVTIYASMSDYIRVRGMLKVNVHVEQR
jgi:hypothetical protein